MSVEGKGMSMRLAIFSLAVAAATCSGFTLHSHNDFNQRRPLQDAVAAKVSSVEVDVVDRWGEVKVTHIGIFTDGSLREKYLDPLQKLINDRGSALGDGKPFYLWIEIRGIFARGGVVPLLRTLLEQYPMFERYNARGETVRKGPVVAIISGYSAFKHEYFDGQAVTPACLGLNDREWQTPGFDPRAKWLSLRWSRHADWKGEGAPPPGLAEKIRALVSGIHAQGRRLRFWGNPETGEFWDLMKETGVDQASTDSLP
jgi:hypothetical protein